MITVAMEMVKFNNKLERFIKKSSLSADLVIKKTAFDLLSNILRPPPYGRHPVDTGRARAGWYASMKALGVHGRGLYSGLKSKSQISIGKKEGRYYQKLGEGVNNKGIKMINGVKYILFLEYGHSKKQAPYGMVRISMRKMRYRFSANLTKGIKNSWS